MTTTSSGRARLVGGFLLTQRHRGACTEQTAGLFFDDGRGSKARHQAAKAICRLCPILYDCRAYARADPTLEGIWGGETEDERRTARRTSTSVPAGDNQEGRRLAATVAQLASRRGLPAAARTLEVPPATLRRVLVLYGLDQPPIPPVLPASAKGGEPQRPPAHRPPATASSSRRPANRSRSSSPSRAGPSPGPNPSARPTTPAIRSSDPPPILLESTSPPAPAKEHT